MKKVCGLLLTVFLCSNVAAGGSTEYGKITEMYTSLDWTMVIVPDITSSTTRDPNPDLCPKSTYYSIEPEDKNYQAMHSVLMAAHMAGKDVRFYVSGCSGQNNEFPRIISIWSK